MSLAERIHEQLWLDSGEGLLDDEQTQARIHELIDDLAPLVTRDEASAVAAEVLAFVGGLGPLHRLGARAEVSEIMVNGDGSVWVEVAGRLEREAMRLEPDDVVHLIRRLASRAGRRIDASRPAVDLRLDDGSRLHAIIPPLAVDGPCVTIRRFRPTAVALGELADRRAAELLRAAVADRSSIVIAGATSSGKTTLLNALGAELDPSERIVTIEEAAELRLPGDHIVRLETRTQTEATPAVGVRELVRHALRMRPDRIVCGEMRGGEALDLIQAMNTGHAGSLSTVHANSTSDAMRRIETMMLLGDVDLPLSVAREQLAACVDLVVMMRRGRDGSREVEAIDRVPDEPTKRWRLQPLFERVEHGGSPHRERAR